MELKCDKEPKLHQSAGKDLKDFLFQKFSCQGEADYQASRVKTSAQNREKVPQEDCFVTLSWTGAEKQSVPLGSTCLP